MFELIITEPWEFGTVNENGPFNVDVKRGAKDSWLIIFKKKIKFKKNSSRYLLGKFIDEKNNPNHVLTKQIQLAFIEDLTEANFRGYDFNKIRGNFLRGEINLTRCSDDEIQRIKLTF